MAIRLILDTDIGTDVDDILALGLALSSPEIALEGITCVYGDVMLRARIVDKVLTSAGRQEIPVRLGAESPLLGLRRVYWPGHEGTGILTEADPVPDFSLENAAAFIVRTVMDNPGQITLAAIGPLTNIALAIKLEPLLVKNLAGLWLMGGAIRSNNQLHLPYTEHNLGSDPEAAHIVFTSGAEIHQVPLDVTLQTRLTAADLKTIHENKAALAQVLVRQVELYPFFAKEGFTYMHDPLVIAAMIDPDLLTWDLLHVDIELKSRLCPGASLAHSVDEDYPANALVALGVDAGRFQTMLVERAAGTALVSEQL